MSSPISPCYRICHPECLRVRRWDDECVVYNDVTGDTHLLAGLADRVFDRLRKGPVSKSELADAAASEGNFALDDVLARLSRLGLCEPLT